MSKELYIICGFALMVLIFMFSQSEEPSGVEKCKKFAKEHSTYYMEIGKYSTQEELRAGELRAYQICVAEAVKSF